MKKPFPLLTALLALLPALAAAGPTQWSNQEAAPARQAAGASAHYSLRSLKVGAPLHGQTASRSYRLKWSPARRPMATDTAKPDFRILTPGADTTVKGNPIPMLVEIDGQVITHYQNLAAGWNTVILQAANESGNTALDTVRIFLDTVTPPPCRPVIAAIPARIAQLGQQFAALDLSGYVSHCSYPVGQLQFLVSGGTKVSGSVSGAKINFTLNDAAWYGNDSLKLVVQDPDGRRDSALVRLQRRNTLTVNAIVRDFKENNTTDPSNNHPDFQPSASTCSGIGDLEPRIKVTGADPDDRNPVQLPGNTDCFRTRFPEWYTTSQDTLINRPFQVNLTFVDGGNGTIKYTNPNFFPIDKDSVFTPIGKASKTFGHLQAAFPQHNFGFTMEFHAQFQYKRGSNQVFKFTGDDDVWVYIHDSLVIDLGGIHAPLTDSVNLDNLPAGFLADGQVYPLDFFSAERHTSGSNILITTSLSLSNAQSQISLDKKNYPAATASGIVTLVDQSNGPEIETRTVEITSSNGDTLRSTTTESATFPGKFTRTFAMGSGPVNPNDTTLQITDPGTLSARYIDPDFGDTTTTISTYGPQNVVAITAPLENQLVNHSPIAVAWNVNGLPQATQLTAALAQGANRIIRSFTDASGTSADTVNLAMDSIPPHITASGSPADGNHGWYRNAATVSFTCSDETRLVSCQVPFTVTGNGRNIPVSGQARDSAGNTATATLGIFKDAIAPLLALVSATQVPLKAGARVTLGLTALDSLSGLETLTCDGHPVAAGANPRSYQEVLPAGAQSIACMAIDSAGKYPGQILPHHRCRQPCTRGQAGCLFRQLQRQPERAGTRLTRQRQRLRGGYAERRAGPCARAWDRRPQRQRFLHLRANARIRRARFHFLPSDGRQGHFRSGLGSGHSIACPLDPGHHLARGQFPHAPAHYFRAIHRERIRAQPHLRAVGRAQQAGGGHIGRFGPPGGGYRAGPQGRHRACHRLHGPGQRVLHQPKPCRRGLESGRGSAGHRDLANPDGRA